jgi:hypothetical protein
MYRSDIFNTVKDYVTADDVSLAHCVGICADVTTALTEDRKGFQPEVRRAATL